MDETRQFTRRNFLKTGPWRLEHAHADRKMLFRELALLRDMLRRWMREMTAAD